MKQVCVLSEPVNLGADGAPDWEYSKILCDYTGLYEYVENTTTSASFYLEKSFTYGDFFVMGFITLFILFQIVKIIWDKWIY